MRIAGIYHFLEISSSKFPALPDMVLRYRCRFGSIYVREKTVSSMKFVKFKYRFNTHWPSSVDSCYFIRESQHWITSEREGYPKDLLRIMPGVFHVNASLVRHFWIISAVNLCFWYKYLNDYSVTIVLFVPLNNNISPFSWCFTWSIGPTYLCNYFLYPS